jgi:hypothetical protein
VEFGLVWNWSWFARDGSAIQRARSDFIVNALRHNLPSGSLWHEKRFARGQLESLGIASTGGMYDINTFNPSNEQLAPRQAMRVFGDLGIEVAHVEHTREYLTPEDIERITITADSDFEALIFNDREAVTSVFRRVTCNMDFVSPDDDVDGYAAWLFGEIADSLGFPITFRPLVFGEVFLPSSDLRDLKQNRDWAYCAAEIIFESPLPIGTVTERFESLVNDNATTSVLNRLGINWLDCVGRYF